MRATSAAALVASQQHTAAQVIKEEPKYGVMKSRLKKTRILSFVFSGNAASGPQLSQAIVLPELEEEEVEPVKPVKRLVPKKKPKPPERDLQAEEAVAKEAERRRAEEAVRVEEEQRAAAAAAAAAAAEEQARQKAATKALAEEVEQAVLAQLVRQLAAEVIEEEIARKARAEEARKVAEEAAEEAEERVAMPAPAAKLKKKRRSPSPQRPSPAHQLLSGERAGPSWSHKQQQRAATWSWSPDERAQAQTRGSSGEAGTRSRASPTGHRQRAPASSGGGGGGGASTGGGGGHSPLRQQRSSPQQLAHVDRLAAAEAIPLYTGLVVSPRMAEVRGMSALPACRSGGRDEWLNEQIEKLLKRGLGKSPGAIDSGMFSESDRDSDSGGERTRPHQMACCRASTISSAAMAHAHARGASSASPKVASPISPPHATRKSSPKPSPLPNSSPKALPPRPAPNPGLAADSTVTSPAVMAPAAQAAPLEEAKRSASLALVVDTPGGPSSGGKGDSAAVSKEREGGSSRSSPPGEMEASARRGLFGFTSMRRGKPSPGQPDGLPAQDSAAEDALKGAVPSGIASGMSIGSPASTNSPPALATTSSSPPTQAYSGMGSASGGVTTFADARGTESLAHASSIRPSQSSAQLTKDAFQTPTLKEPALASVSTHSAGVVSSTAAQRPSSPSHVRSELWDAGMESASLEEAVSVLLLQGVASRALASSSMARLVTLSTGLPLSEQRLRGAGGRAWATSMREVALPCLEALGQGRAGVHSFRVLVNIMRAHTDNAVARRASPRASSPRLDRVLRDSHEEAADTRATQVKVQCVAFTLLRRLCVREERRGQAAEAGAIGAVLGAMRALPEEASVQAGGCRTLLTLCAGQATVAAASSPRAAFDSVEDDSRVGGHEGRCMLACEEGVLDVLASVLEAYSPPKDPTAPPRGEKRDRALGRGALNQAVLCVLALTFGSVIRAHWAVQAGVVTALSTAARRARMPGARPLAFVDKIDLARQWLEMQARLLGPRSIMQDVVPRNTIMHGIGTSGKMLSTIDTETALLTDCMPCLPSCLLQAAGKCLRNDRSNNHANRL